MNAIWLIPACLIFHFMFQIFSRMATVESRWLASKALSSGGVLFVVER
nr:MAG TPA: hypothetical protein [Caudoviricetes sp.]